MQIVWPHAAAYSLLGPQFIEHARQAGRPIRVMPEAIEAIRTSAYPTPAQRPLNSRLDTGKLQAAFGLVMPDWQVGVERMLAEILGQ